MVNKWIWRSGGAQQDEALYLLVIFNVVQVCFLCQTQVEEGLPLSLHRISVDLVEEEEEEKRKVQVRLWHVSVSL